MSFAAESPRWLVSAGRIDEAAQVVEYTLGIPVTAAELSELAPEPGATRGSSTALFRGVYLRRTVFVVTLFSCAIIPLFPLLTFGPKLVKRPGSAAGTSLIWARQSSNWYSRSAVCSPCGCRNRWAAGRPSSGRSR